MRGAVRACAGVVFAAIVAAGATLHADTVQLSMHGGRVSLSATNATPAQIFDAWSRAGGVLIVNAERMPATPLTLTLENVPEEQALETLLRPVTGYLARRRADPDPDRSVFDRIVIMPTPAAPRPVATAAPAPAAAPAPRPATALFPPSSPPQAQPPAQTQQQPPAGIQQGPGVMRLIGPDGRPVEDDQADAPQQPYTPGDRPDTRAPVARPQVPPPPAAPPQGTQSTPPTSAPVGVPRPGMVVPAPAQPGQPSQPQRQQ
jgi:hypothetical protein